MGEVEKASRYRGRWRVENEGREGGLKEMANETKRAYHQLSPPLSTHTRVRARTHTHTTFYLYLSFFANTDTNTNACAYANVTRSLRTHKGRTTLNKLTLKKWTTDSSRGNHWVSRDPLCFFFLVSFSFTFYFFLFSFFSL